MNEFDIQLSFRHEASWARWRKDRLRNNPPPFLRPLVTIKEAMEALNRSESYVRNRIDDGRLNTWKDPISKRVWILQDDLNILKSDIRALEEKGETRGGKRGPRNPTPDPQHPTPEDFEDLDAIGGWEHPKPPEIIGGAAIEESARESQARYEQKQRVNEEWYAAELAKLEDRDPEEAVHQLRLERGWITPAPEEPEAETESDSMPSVFAAPPKTAIRNPKSAIARPISYANPNPRPRTPPEPYIDPDDPPCVTTDESRIEVPFPMGWITGREVENILQVTHAWVCHFVKQGKLQRRKKPGATGRKGWLYDSVEVEALAESRLTGHSGPIPGKNLNAWGSRANPIELAEFNGWISLNDAAAILGIRPDAVGRLCDRGLLPAKQKEPGKRGSRVCVPHAQVVRLMERPEYQQRRKWSRGEKTRTEEEIEQAKEDWLPFGVAPIENRGQSLRTDHGGYYNTTQVAQMLGITRPAVNRLRNRGRLKGHKLNEPRKGRTGRNTWWFYLKEDVDALRSDPAYNANHKRWITTRNRMAGWGGQDEW